MRAARLMSAVSPARLEIALVFQAGDWRYVGRFGAMGRFAYKVDALTALPKLLAKLRRRGWRAPVELLIQQPWGELLRSAPELSSSAAGGS